MSGVNLGKWDTASQSGLTSVEVERSRQLHGSNVLTAKKKRGLARSFLSNFGDPMIKVLLIALGINLVFLLESSNWFESIGIAVAVLIAVVVSTLSEYGSESAFERLQQASSNLEVRLRRNSKTVLLPMSEIVVDDVVLLGYGDRVPADGIMLSGRLEVDQSALNGESKEAVKTADGAGKDGLLHPRHLFSGTVVNAGEGCMRVTAVGAQTFWGKLAVEVQADSPKSPLKARLEELAHKISIFGYTGAVLVALAYLFNVLIIDLGFDLAATKASLSDLEFLLPHLLRAATLSVTVIVMAVPEGLPMMITVVLSANMRRMLKDNVLVRKLNGIETAGSMNILFTDKTGTLTEGRLKVASIVFGDGEIRQADRLEGLGARIRLMALSLTKNTAAEMSDSRAIGGNATDRALLEYGASLNATPFKVAKGAVLPFSSELKYMATTVAGERNLTLIKGAPEKLLPHCIGCYAPDGSVVPLKARAGLLRATEALAAQAQRIVAVATSESRSVKELDGLVLVALIGIRDRVRPQAAESIRTLTSAGIQTVMITGDAPGTAVAVARETGIVRSEQDLILTSSQLAALGDEELIARLPRLRVVARALPSDKSRLVRLAQSADQVVGMTGDGVNDAPALKKSDVGFCMGSGTEVAKEAGDIVILDDNILSISRAVSYGRTIFKSIRKFVIFQLSINLCAMAVSIIAPLLNVDTPITVIQMLWINLVMDTLAGLAFGGERPRKKYMTEPPKKRNQSIINGYMLQQIAFTSIYTAAVCVWFLKSSYIDGVFALRSDAYRMTAFFALFMFMAIFNSLNARTHELNLLDYLALNKQFIWIMSLVVVIQTLLIMFGGQVFRTERLTLAHFLLTLGIAFSVIPLDLLRKLLFNNRQNGT